MGSVATERGKQRCSIQGAIWDAPSLTRLQYSFLFRSSAQARAKFRAGKGDM